MRKKNNKPRNKNQITANKEIPKRKVRNKIKLDKRKKIIPPYNGIPCDSHSERFTLMWLFELKEEGYVDAIMRSPTYLLSEPVTRTYIRRLKTRGVPESETFLRGTVYTPDFLVILTEKGKKCPIFKDINCDVRFNRRDRNYFIHQKGVVHIETKGTKFRGSMADSLEKFGVTSKWLWIKEGIYVNLFQPDKIFPLTFTPKEYLLTDITRKARSIRFTKRTLDQCINIYEKI